MLGKFLSGPPRKTISLYVPRRVFAAKLRCHPASSSRLFTIRRRGRAGGCAERENVENEQRCEEKRGGTRAAEPDRQLSRDFQTLSRLAGFITRVHDRVTRPTGELITRATRSSSSLVFSTDLSSGVVTDVS